MQSKLAVGGAMKAAAFALTEAKCVSFFFRRGAARGSRRRLDSRARLPPSLRYAAGDFRHTVQDAVSSASVRVRAATDNVAGVRVPRFERAPPPATAAPRADLTGLGAGGAQVAGARAAFLDAVALVVELASLQAAFASLDAAIKTTNRRVNALDNVVRPRLEATIAYIKGELDELEREDFFRLKKVQGKKKRDADAAAALRKAAAAPGGGSVATPAAPRSVLGPARDEEVVL